MKITLELENDEEKEQANRFLGSDESPIIVQSQERIMIMRTLMALRQRKERPEVPDARARIQARREERLTNQKGIK